MLPRPNAVADKLILNIMVISLLFRAGLNSPATVASHRLLKVAAVLCSVAVSAPAAFAQQQDKPLDVIELAEKEAERLERTLQLEDWQTFYVDSTLVHDYQAMEQELKELSQSKVTNAAIYQSVQDKWMDVIEESYKKFFTQQQWETYLKQGAARAQKQREKRRLAAQGLKPEKQPKKRK